MHDHTLADLARSGLWGSRLGWGGLLCCWRRRYHLDKVLCDNDAKDEYNADMKHDNKKQ